MIPVKICDDFTADGPTMDDRGKARVFLEVEDDDGIRMVTWLSSMFNFLIFLFKKK